jgi:hypothetical protein
VDRLRCELLARAAFARDEHRDVRLEHLLDLVVHRAHRRRRTHHVAQVVAVAELSLEPRDLVLEAVMRDGSTEGCQHSLLVDRFGEVVITPELGHLDGASDVVDRGQDDHGQCRVAPPEFLEYRDAIHFRHHQVEQHRRRWRAVPGEHLRPGREQLHLIAGTGNHERQELPNPGIIVDYPDEC